MSQMYHPGQDFWPLPEVLARITRTNVVLARKNKEQGSGSTPGQLMKRLFTTDVLSLWLEKQFCTTLSSILQIDAFGMPSNCDQRRYSHCALPEPENTSKGHFQLNLSHFEAPFTFSGQIPKCAYNPPTVHWRKDNFVIFFLLCRDVF